MRKQPDVKLAAIIGDHLDEGKQPAGTVTWERKYKLITPLFGGGVSPAECDPVTIIRGSEIRAHLRFWWRATRGGCYGVDMSEMKKAEAKIWGAAHISKKNTTPPKKRNDEPELPTAQIEVTVNKDTIKDGSPVFAYDRDWSGKIERDGKERPNIKQVDNSIPAYAAFPLRPTDEEREKERNAFKAGHEGEGIVFKKVQKDVEFVLTITFAAEYEKEIRAALWAWETFGGIGARTRRGFGAIQLLESHGPDKSEDTTILPPNPALAEEWVRRELRKHINEQNFPENVPHLSPDLLLPPDPQLYISSVGQQASSVWKDLIGKLSKFRQMRPTIELGRGKSRNGKNKWPEANAIRELHAHRETKQKFPRAAFGLPIIFHFIGRGEPSDYTLEGAKEGSERLASPLILRPLACANKQFVGLAVLLSGTSLPPDGLEISTKGRKAKKVEASLDAKDIEALAIDELKGQSDILKAFMDYLKRK